MPNLDGKVVGLDSVQHRPGARRSEINQRITVEISPVCERLCDAAEIVSSGVTVEGDCAQGRGHSSKHGLKALTHKYWLTEPHSRLHHQLSSVPGRGDVFLESHGTTSSS